MVGVWRPSAYAWGLAGGVRGNGNADEGGVRNGGRSGGSPDLPLVVSGQAVESWRGTLRELLTHEFDLHAVPGYSFFECLSWFAPGAYPPPTSNGTTHPPDADPATPTPAADPAVAAGIEASYEEVREKLAHFCSPAGADDLADYTTRPRRTVAEAMWEFRMCAVPKEYVWELLGRIRARAYSVANACGVEEEGEVDGVEGLSLVDSKTLGGGAAGSAATADARYATATTAAAATSPTHTTYNLDSSLPPSTSPDTPGPILELLVGLVRYKSSLSTPRSGLCSDYLDRLQPGDAVDVALLDGPFSEGWEEEAGGQEDTASLRPLMLVGAGTGVAPLRAVVQARVARERRRRAAREVATGKGADRDGQGDDDDEPSTWLAFGHRSSPAGDGYFVPEFRALARAGLLRLTLAESRQAPAATGDEASARAHAGYVQGALGSEGEGEAVGRWVGGRGAGVWVCGGAGAGLGEGVRGVVEGAAREAVAGTGRGGAGGWEGWVAEGRVRVESW